MKRIFLYLLISLNFFPCEQKIEAKNVNFVDRAALISIIAGSIELWRGISKLVPYLDLKLRHFNQNGISGVYKDFRGLAVTNYSLIFAHADIGLMDSCLGSLLIYIGYSYLLSYKN